MSVDPRDFSDRQLLAHLLFGDLPRRGWTRRPRAIAERMLRVALLTVFAIFLLVAFSGCTVVLWAASL